MIQPDIRKWSNTYAIPKLTSRPGQYACVMGEASTGKILLPELLC